MQAQSLFAFYCLLLQLHVLANADADMFANIMIGGMSIVVDHTC